MMAKQPPRLHARFQIVSVQSIDAAQDMPGH
jgi:hypothetical protein